VIHLTQEISAAAQLCYGQPLEGAPKGNGRGKMQAFMSMSKIIAKRLAIETTACVLFLALAGLMPVLSNPF
jgi:hypothetical protein